MHHQALFLKLRAHLKPNQPEKALVEAGLFVSIGQMNPILDSPLFQPLRKTIAARMQANIASTSLATPAFRLSDSKLLPEDIDYDPRSSGSS